MTHNQKVCPYLELELQLHSCIKDPEEFIRELNDWLHDKLNPQYSTDITMDVLTLITESTTGKPVDHSRTINIVEILDRS